MRLFFKRSSLIRDVALSILFFLANLAGLAAGAFPAQTSEEPLTVTGTLVDERGIPTAGVEVTLRPYPSAYEIDLDLLGLSAALPETVDRTRSETDGRFSVSAPLAGPYVLEIRPPVPADRPGAVLPKVYGNLAPLQVSRSLEPNELPNRHDIAVRVLDGHSQPVEGARVIATPTAVRSDRWTRVAAYDQPERLYPRFHRAAAMTDATGIARFLMPTAEAKIVATAPGFLVATATTQSGRTALRLDRAAGIPFRVLGPDGEPTPLVLIRSTGRTGVPLAVTDDSGIAVVPRLADASVQYEFERADHAFARRTPQHADAAVIDVRLDDPLRIPGRVVDAVSSLPIQGAAVWVRASPGHNALTGPNGVFDLTTRPQRDTARLSVDAAGYLSAWASNETPALGSPTEVSVGLTPAAPITGLVTDVHDRPVAGASISAEPRDLRLTGPPATFRSQRATSAEDGSFRLPDLTYDNAYRFAARAEGYSRTVVDLAPIEAGVAAPLVRIVLTTGRQAWGKMIDTDGNPVAGAEVKLRWALDNVRPLFRDGLDATESTATDERGAFSFPAVAAGEYEVLVSHAEYVGSGAPRAEVPAGEGDIDLGVFTLAAGARIHGLVTNPEGEPVAGADIRARVPLSMDRDQERTATSDTDGAFILTGLPHELIDLTVRADGYTPLSLPGARPGLEEAILIELKTGALLTGRVIDTDGRPAAGVRVELEPDFQSRFRNRAWSARDFLKRTDGDGRFRFEHVDGGLWSLKAWQGQAEATLDGIELQPGTEREIDLQLQTQDQLRVIVSTRFGKPVSDARIRVVPEGAIRSLGYGRTDASGRVQIGVVPGDAEVTVKHELYQDESTLMVLQPGKNELVLQLGAGGAIRGSVRSGDGTPLGLATVEAHTEDSLDFPIAYRQYASPSLKTISDQGGQFQLTGLEPGKYLLVARASGFASDGPQPIEVDGQSVDGVEIVLEAGASITGAVSGLDASDLSSVKISATRNADWKVTAPNPKGNFAFEGVAPGEWQIVATKGSGFGSRSAERSVTIPTGATDAFIELSFQRGLRLSGQVLVGGQPVVGGFLGTVPAGTEELRWTRTDHRGHFEVEGLEPGSYRLEIEQPYGGAEQRSIDLDTDLEGLRIDLQPSATIVGVVLDTTTGKPLGGASLTAGNEAQIATLARDGNAIALGTAGSTFSAAGGRFELRLGPNVEQLWVTRDRYASALLPLSIAPGQRQTGLVIELQQSSSEPGN